MKIADLLDEIEQTCGVRDIRNACSPVLTDEASLLIKKLNPHGWQESYRRAFGRYPSQEVFQQRADMAIKEVEGLIEFEKFVDSVAGNYGIFIQKARELATRLKEYRDSIPAYF